MAFQEIASKGAGSFFKWDAHGKSVTGRYLGIFQGKVLNGRQTEYAKFIQSDGVEIKVNATTVLGRRLREEFTSGDVLRITYTHDEKGSQPMPAKIFRIEKDTSGALPPVVTAPPQLPPVQPAVPGVSPEALAAAMAILQAQQKPTEVAVAQPVPATAPQVPVSEYDRLIGVLRGSNPKGAAAIEGALDQLYPDPAVKLQKLQETLKQQGVAA